MDKSKAKRKIIPIGPAQEAGLIPIAQEEPKQISSVEAQIALHQDKQRRAKLYAEGVQKLGRELHCIIRPVITYRGTQVEAGIDFVPLDINQEMPS